MKLNWFVTDDDAASQVVAVVLLIGVVILMAAVVGPVVVGMGQGATEGSPAPQAKFAWSYEGAGSPSTLEVTHKGGETIEKENLRFVGSESGELSPSWNDGDDRLKVTESGELSGVQSDEVVRVFWADPDDDTQQLIVQWIGPDAEPPDE